MLTLREMIQKDVPNASKPALQTLQNVFGFVPNVAVAMAASPAALEGYVAGLGALGNVVGLTPLEREIAMLAASRANGADYSVVVHATLAAKLGASAEMVQAARVGEHVADARLASVQRFAEVLMVSRGGVPEEAIKAFIEAGFSDAAIVEVAFGVALKLFANAMVSIAHPALDAGFAST